MKRIVICLLLMISLLTACSTELHERLLVRAIGIDKSGDEWRVTALISCPEEDGREISITETGSTVAAALEGISRNTGKKPLYSHNSLLIFGRECAAYGFSDCMDFFIRDRESRPTVKIAVSDKTAEKLLSDGEISKRAESIDLLLTENKYNGVTLDTSIIDLYNGCTGPNKCDALPVLNASGEIYVKGAALITNMKLSDELDIESLKGYLVLRGKLSSCESEILSAYCGKTVIETEKTDCVVRFIKAEPKSIFTIKIRAYGELNSISLRGKIIESVAYDEMEELYAEALMRDVMSYLGSSVCSSGTDATGFGRAIAEADECMWRDEFVPRDDFLKSCEYRVEIDAVIDRTEAEDRPYL